MSRTFASAACSFALDARTSAAARVTMEWCQYVNATAIGRYADYLARELVPFVDKEFRTLASRGG